MMALFVVLWLLTQADVRLRQQIAQYFRQPGVLPGGAVISPYANELYSRTPKVVTRELLVAQGQGEQELLENEKKAIDQTLMRRPELALLRDHLIVQVTDTGLSIQVVDRGDDLLFDLSSARLKPALVSLLKQLGRQLGHLPNRIQLGGHTDSRPFPPEVAMTNWELAFARANNARRVLDAIAALARSAAGRQAVLELRPTSERTEAERRLDLLAELVALAAEAGRPPTADVPLLAPALAAAAPDGATLEPRRLAEVRDLLAAARQLRAYLRRDPARFPRLAAEGEAIDPVPEVSQPLGAALDETGQVRDEDRKSV